MSLLVRLPLSPSQIESQPVCIPQKDSSLRALSQQGAHIHPPARHVPLTHAQVDTPAQLIAQLRSHRTHLGLCQSARRSLLLETTTAAAALALARGVEVVGVVLDTQLFSGVAHPLVIAVRLLLGQHRVGERLGQRHTRLETRRHLGVQRQRLDEVLPLGPALLVHLVREAPRRQHLFGRAEHHADTAPLTTRRTAGAMDVGVGSARHVVVQHLVDLLDIETTRGNVGGDEDRVARRREAFQRAETRLLGHLRVQRQGCQVEVGEQRREAADGEDGVGEDDGAFAGVEEQYGIEVEILYVVRRMILACMSSQLTFSIAPHSISPSRSPVAIWLTGLTSMNLGSRRNLRHFIK